MSESYTTGGDTLIMAFKTDWLGQSFMPLEDHILEYIDLELRGVLVLPEPVILVYWADWLGHPMGEYISRNNYTIEQHCGFFTTGRARFRMTPTLLSKGIQYVIIVRNYPPLPSGNLYWQYDKDDATYPRGYRISSTDGGATWTDHPGDDHIFAEFGTPPLPKADPPPPIEHFAIPDITQILTMDGIQLYLPTTVPCHLTCYWTDKQPLKHPLSRTIRGYTVPWSTYFCFVAWHAVEQNEPGDTLYHTFTLEPWPECETRWFTFRGTVDNILSPSVGPIFEKHCPGPYTFIKNPSFEDWPDPTKPPTHWTFSSSGLPSGTLTRDTIDKTHGKHSACLSIIPGQYFTVLTQRIDAIPYRGKHIHIQGDQKGKPYWFTGTYVGIDGTPRYWRHDTPDSPDYWSRSYFTALVKPDSTTITVQIRIDYITGQPNTCHFDNLRNIVY